MRSSRLLAILLLGLAACSVQTEPPPEFPDDPAPDPATQRSFTLSTDTTGNSVDPGEGIAGIPVRVERIRTFEDEVAFELFGAPEGILGSFDPPSTRGDLSTLTLTVDAATPSGDYDLTVRGKSGGFSNTVQIPLFVTEAANGQPGFSLSLSPSSLNLLSGESESVRVRFNRNGDVDAIGLSVTGEPEGVNVEIDTSAQNPTLRVTANGNAAPGNYALTVRGKSGELSSSTQLGLSISSEEDSSASGSARVQGSVRTANADISLRTMATSQASATSGKAALSTLLGTEIEERPAFVPGQVLVQYRTGKLSKQSAQQTAQMKAALRQRYSLNLLEAGAGQQPDLLTIPENREVEDIAEELRRDLNVLHAEPNYYLYPAALPNDPNIEEQWALSATGSPVAWQAETGEGGDVVIAILDSGFDLSHEDLRSRFAPGYDFCALASGDCTNAPSDPDPSYGNPQNSHGTLVAGVAGAAGDNGRGVAGVAYGDRVKLLPVKLFNNAGLGATSQSFIQGIRWAVGLEVGGSVPTNRNPAQVINISLGGDFNSSIVQSAVDEARGRGAVIVAATGNSGRGGAEGGILSPAAAQGVIGVGSIGRDFTRSCFSNYGMGERNGPGGVDLVAPGGEAAAASCNKGSYGLLSTSLGNRYESAIGTSFATPMVAGAAALILSHEPNLSVSQVEERLLSGAYFSSTMNRNEYGRGVLRVERSLGLAGPGDQVSVTASGENVADSDLATVTLDLFGGSSTYSLEDLAAGRYRVEATAKGLSGEEILTLRDDERREDVMIELR